MAINPGIALGVEAPKPLDMLGAYGNALSLKNLVNQGKAQELQIQQAEREQQKQMRLSDLARASGGDMDKFAAGMGAIDPMGALDYGLKAKKFDMERRKAALEQADGFNKLFLGSANAVRESGYSQDVYNAELQRLRALGVPEQMLANVPPQVSKQYIDANIAASMTNADRLARDKEEFDRLYPGEYGKAIHAQEQFRKRTADMERESREMGRGGVNAAGEIVAPEIQTEPTVTPFDPLIARMAQGDENQPFLRGKTGKIVPNQPVQDFQTAKAKAGATKVEVGVNAYEKELNKRDAEAVADARKGAEQAAGAASDARAIAQILKGQNSGKWTEMQAALGQWLPGSQYANVTSVVGLADAIRGRAGPSMRIPGSGAMSDFETKQLMGIFPQLIQSDAGRDLTARVLERVAERQAIAADIKDEMVRGGTYSVREFNKRIKAEFGEGLLTTEEKATLKRLQSGEKPQMGSRENPFKIRGDDGYDALPDGAFYVGPDNVPRQKPAKATRPKP